MPLQLNYTNPATGVQYPASYWAIERAIIKPAPGSPHTIFFIGGWFTQAQYAAGKQPFEAKFYRFNTVPTGGQTFAQVVAALYAWVQANPDENGVLFFAGATTVP